jgi:uncharacterized protein YeaO (DUF488 family)
MTIISQRPYHLVPTPNDYLVLVDRLWPRGINKADLKLDEWNKEVAPVTELRQWFNHEPEKWGEFRTRYLEELKPHRTELQRLAEIASHKRLVLIYAARSETISHAIILKQAIETAQHQSVHKQA